MPFPYPPLALAKLVIGFEPAHHHPIFSHSVVWHFEAFELWHFEPWQFEVYHSPAVLGPGFCLVCRGQIEPRPQQIEPRPWLYPGRLPVALVARSVVAAGTPAAPAATERGRSRREVARQGLGTDDEGPGSSQCHGNHLRRLQLGEFEG